MRVQDCSGVHSESKTIPNYTASLCLIKEHWRKLPEKDPALANSSVTVGKLFKFCFFLCKLKLIIEYYYSVIIVFSVLREMIHVQFLAQDIQI